MKRFHILFSALVMLLSPVFMVTSFVSAAGANLVANPSVETINPTNANLPQYWQKNKWGTNTTTFSIIKTAGHTGNNSVKTQITQYTSGDAKWYFNSAVVSPNQTYTFSDFYKSSVATEVVVQVESTTGVMSYYSIGSPAASSITWKQFTANFTTPANAKKATVLHVIKKVGWLQLDDASFGLAGAVQPVAPTVSVTSPTAGSTVSGKTVTLTAGAASQTSVVAGVQFKIDGANVGAEDTSAPYTTVWDTTLIANGNHNITAVARDAGGLSTTSSSISVNVNNVTLISPTISITSPVENTVLDKIAMITATAASQGSTVAGVQFKIDGVNSGTEDTVAPYEFAWDTESVTNGNYSLTAVARSANGLSTTSLPIQVSVNNVVLIAPTVNITSPSNNSTLNGTHTITATAASQGSTVAGVQFKIDGVDFGTEDTTAPYETVWNTTTATNGSHSLTAVVRSANGLNATSSVVTVTVNNVAPPVDDENTILNPSVETVNPTNNLMPLNWNHSSWGANTVSFNYDTNGHTGGRSVTTNVSAYTNGDAKWYADPVSVLPGKSYIYRDYYKSNVENHVVLAFIDASGNYTYQYISSVSAASDWTLYEANFVAPISAAKVIVFHLIDKVGSLTIDDALLQVGVTAPIGGIIPNGSLELGSSVPTGWQTNSWGANIAIYQWVNEGHTGTKSIKTTVSSYVNGDAKWFFNPITTLTPGSQYRFTSWYKTNVTPKAVAMFVKADGTEQYFGMPNPQPNGSTTEWQKYSEVFLVPLDAVSVSVFLFVNENGWLQTDDYTISEYHPTGLSRPLLSLTFDDGAEDNVTTALPLLNQYGFRSTQCYATTFIENNPDQAINNVLAFYNSGHEICSHSVTHPFLTTLNATDLTYELQHSKQYLESIIGVPVVSFASPYGDYNQSVNTVIAQNYQSHRTVDEGFNSIDNFDKYRLRVQNVLDTTTASQINSWIEQAKTDNTWLILVYHRVANDPGPYDTNIATFEQHLDVIKNSGIVVKTLNDALTEVQVQL